MWYALSSSRGGEESSGLKSSSSPAVPSVCPSGSTEIPGSAYRCEGRNQEVAANAIRVKMGRAKAGFQLVRSLEDRRGRGFFLFSSFFLS